jgi:hypothetical protein
MAHPGYPGHHQRNPPQRGVRAKDGRTHRRPDQYCHWDGSVFRRYIRVLLVAAEGLTKFSKLQKGNLHPTNFDNFSSPTLLLPIIISLIEKEHVLLGGISMSNPDFVVRIVKEIDGKDKSINVVSSQHSEKSLKLPAQRDN